MNLQDITLCAKIQSADLARGVNWAKPSRLPNCRPHTRMRSLVAGSVLVLTSLLSTVAHAGPFTDAFAAALGKPHLCQSAPIVSRVKPAKLPSVTKTLVCGEWVELWQGSGKGRTCEWR